MQTLSPILDSFLQLIHTDSLPHLGPEVRPEATNAQKIEKSVSDFCSSHQLGPMQTQLLKSAALLWHDDLEGSHTISQDIKSSDGSFLHGIMHRREPDSSNAKYWFRLVGDHTAFPSIAAAVDSYAQDNGIENLTSNLVNSGDWDPFAFVDACSRALRGDRKAESYATLQQIQAIEFRELVSEILR